MERFTINLQFVIIEFIFFPDRSSLSNFHITQNKLSSTRFMCNFFFALQTRKFDRKDQEIERKLLLLLKSGEGERERARRKNNFRKLNLLWKVVVQRRSREHLVCLSE